MCFGCGLVLRAGLRTGGQNQHKFIHARPVIVQEKLSFMQLHQRAGQGQSDACALLPHSFLEPVKRFEYAFFHFRGYDGAVVSDLYDNLRIVPTNLRFVVRRTDIRRFRKTG